MRLRVLVSGIVAAIWLMLVLSGMSVMLVYGATPGTEATPPVRWPIDSAIAAPSRGATAVMFLHPQCPCSRATLEELQRVMVKARVRSHWHVVFVLPPGAPDDWRRSDLLQTAKSVPGLSVHHDQDGAEAKRFGAATSGQIVYYTHDGRLLFSGGITGSRGHVGDNDGRRALIALGQGILPRVWQTPVYGCPLFNEAACCDDASCREGAACRS